MSRDWKKHFPYPEYRHNQENVIDRIIKEFENGKRFVIAEMPTGAGKSAIGSTVGRYFEEYYYVTAQKILQTQLTNDFGEGGRWADVNNPMIELKGRNAYECIYYKQALRDPKYKKSRKKFEYIDKKSKEDIDCSIGECKKQGLASLDYCKKSCLYFKQLAKAMYSPAVLMNFHSFIFQTQFVKKWPHKKLLIIDEAHNTEQVLMDFISFSFSDLRYEFEIPKLSSAEEYFLFFEDIEITEIIRENILRACSKGDSKEEEYWMQQAFKYLKFSESIQTHEWISNWEKKEIKGKNNKFYNSVELKPLYIKDFSEELLFYKVDKILLMSATILSVDIMCESLGINRSETFATRLSSDFPIKNRPIHVQPVGKMSYKNKSQTIPKMMKKIEKLASQYSDVRGIIHTHNFEIANYIQNNASDDLKIRLFLQTDYSTKEDMLEQHAKSDNGIIVAPAMHEGLDLKDDLSRFQIIVKMPYPGIGNNPQLKRRMELNSEYYQYLSALKLVQSYGRSVRSSTDWADTYILDEDFKMFYKRSPHLLPKWFKEAVV